MANVEEAVLFLVIFYVVKVIVKRFKVNKSENARKAINHVLL